MSRYVLACLVVIAGTSLSDAKAQSDTDGSNTLMKPPAIEACFRLGRDALRNEAQAMAESAAYSMQERLKQILLNLRADQDIEKMLACVQRRRK